MGKSAKKKPRLPKAEEEPKFDAAPIVLSSDDEADDDLSLKIVEKAMSRARNGNPSSSSFKPEVIIREVKKKIKKAKERKKEKMEAQDNAVSGSNSDEKVEDVETKDEGGAPKETDATLETNPSEKSDNIVLRKLLRVPRYFDPPDSSWGNCYNCGEGGHSAANCTSARRKKPCFVCGSLEHNVKQCNKGKDCFICNKGGHRAKDCPEKFNWGSRNAKICLKCGDSGHEMFSCKNIYASDDLKEIQCYVCKGFGHLCCVNYANAGSREVSCYRCGQLGHSGLECARVQAEAEAETSSRSCYRCGEGGHISCKCKRKSPATMTTAKKEKRKSDFSRSVPQDLGRRKTHRQLRGRGGWITEDPSDWGSPFHGYNKSNAYSNGRGQGRKLQYQSGGHRFSASKSSNYSGRRENGWQ